MLKLEEFVKEFNIEAVSPIGRRDMYAAYLYGYVTGLGQKVRVHTIKKDSDV